MSVSVAILTLNEESTLPACLASVQWSDDIVVLDSFSHDKTLEVARSRNARVVQRDFDGYASQRNAALALPFRNPWVLMLDADERVPGDLRDEMLSAVRRASNKTSIFRVRRKDFFMGRWLKRSSGYPTWFGRLLRVGRVRVEREINEQYHADGEVAPLLSHLHHYPFSKGVAFWLERHNRYSTMEAQALETEMHSPVAVSGLLSRDPSFRRQTAKQLAYRLPLRPLLVLGYLLVVRGGILDGRPGVSYAILRSIYEYMIDIKRTELRRARAGLPI